MFTKIFTCIFISLILAFYVSRSSANFSGFRYHAFPIQSCADNSSFFGYCIDCITQVDCNNGEETATNVCTDDQACRSNSIYSACSDLSTVPGCSCPPDETVQIADPYDNTKYLVCVDGDRHIFTCPNGEVYNNETESCYTPTTTTPSTTTQSGCPAGENIIIAINCTCFRYCFNNGEFTDSCCDDGEIWDEDSQSCQFYELFTCVGKEDGMYVDYHNCSIYYTCVDQELFTTKYCSDGLIYNVTTATCEDGECDALEDCGVCPDDDTYIKIDCLNYYDCTENTDPSGPEFIPVPETCPEGTCFDEDTGSCSSVTEV